MIKKSHILKLAKKIKNKILYRKANWVYFKKKFKYFISSNINSFRRREKIAEKLEQKVYEWLKQKRFSLTIVEMGLE